MRAPIAKLLLAALAACLLAAPPALSASVPTKGAPAAGSDLKATKATVAKLAAMTPEQLAELDRRLAKALTLYYDRNYEEALPLFQDIAKEVQTTDLMFWTGNCAMKLGKADLAVKSYHKALEINPELHRVRLELSAALMAQSRYDEAKKRGQPGLADRTAGYRARQHRKNAGRDGKAGPQDLLQLAALAGLSLG